MKTLIAIPCFDKVDTKFYQSFVDLQKPGDSSYTVLSNTLIYIARNIIAGNALQAGFDRVFWMDSDMIFPADALTKLSQDMDENGLDYVSGLYFTRRPPVIKPNAFSSLWWEQKEDGIDTGADHLWTYPDNSLVEVAATGFGCCLTTVDLIKRVGDKFGSPFTPIDGMGEDLAFCLRARKAGARLWLDTSVKCGHIGQMVFDEEYYKKQGVPEHGS